MKFTKEDAYKDLVSKIPNKGQTLNLSERSINEQLDTLIPLLANDETELDDFVTKVLPIFKTADGNVKNDVSAGINEYKKNNPTVKTTPQQTPPVVESKVVDTNKELLDRLASLEKEIADSKKAKTISGIRESLISEIKNKGVKDDEWIESFISEVNITEDFDVNAKAEHYVGVYNKMNACVTANVTPASTGGGTSDKDLSDFIKGASDYVKSQRLN